MATASAIPVIRNVPPTSGSTPKLWGLITGDHSVPNRNSPRPTSSKKTKVSRSSEITMPVVVSTDISAAISRIALITSSPIRRRATPRTGVARALCCSLPCCPGRFGR